MTARHFLVLTSVTVLGITMGVTRTSAQDLVIDHFDGTATTLTLGEALLGVGECVELEATIEVCNEALYGSEEADVSVKFLGWRARRTSGRRAAPRH